MKIPLMKSIHRIERSSGKSRAIGEDATGAPVFEAIPEIIQPGTFFRPRDETEMRELLEARACRPAERGEGARAKAAEGKDPDAEEPLDPPIWARPGPAMPNSIDPIEDDEAGDDGHDLL